jgi:hypothetical protein
LNELCIIPECSPGCGKTQGFKPYQKTIDETTDVQLLQKIGVFIPKVLKYEFPAEIAAIFNVQTLTECYDAFLKVIKPDKEPTVNGILKIDPDLKNKYSFIKLNPK